MNDKELYINELNGDQELSIQLKDKVEQLLNKKNLIKALQVEVLELEDELVKSNFNVIGIKDLNVRVSITQPFEEQVINYEKTIMENEKNIEDYQIKKEELIVQVSLNKEKVLTDIKMEDLKYDTKSRKAVIGIRELVKNK